MRRWWQRSWWPLRRRDPTHEDRAVRGVLMFSPVAPLLASVLYAFSVSGSTNTQLSVLSVALAVTGAALAVGVILGFLFGLPKVVDRQPAGSPLLKSNTNLDEISDWLTKILVGLGLVQLGRLSHEFGRIASALRPALGGGSEARSFAIALLIYSVINGFLLSYLWTRIDLSERIRKAEVRLRVQVVNVAASIETTLSDKPQPERPERP